MGNRLYVGNLPFSATDHGLRAIFAQFGTVSYCAIVLDRKTGRSRGFGFVEMSTSSQALDAIVQLHGAGYNSCQMVVNEARPIEKRRDGLA